MSTNTELFDLIKSLTKSEKRYFKLYCSLQKGSKLYLNLFHEIEKQKTYNQTKLPGLFNNNKGMLAFNKNYLKKIIFRSLEAYHSVKSIDAVIQNMILRCKILFNKALYAQYFASIKKTKKYALKYERFGYYLEALEMEKMFINKQEIKSGEEDMLCDEAAGVIEQLSNSYEYSRIIRSLFVFFRSAGTSRIAGHEETLKSIVSSSLMSEVKMAKSGKAKMTYYRIWEVINKIKAEHGSVIECSEKMLNIINNNPYPFEDFIVDFRMDAVFSIISSCIKSGRLERAEDEIKKIKKRKLSSPAEKSDIGLSIEYYQFEIHLKKYDIKKISASIPRLESLLELYKNKIESDQELMIHFKLICGYIIKEDFQGALAKANFLLRHQLLVTRKDIESFTRILTLIIHYELKNYSLLPYLIRSTFRFLVRSEKLFKFESLVISFLRKQPLVTNKDELNFSFVTLHKEMRKLTQDNFERNAFEYFDFVKWIQKKLTKNHFTADK